MRCEECRQELWKAGDSAPAGTYVRVDDLSYRSVTLKQAGPLPTTFDGHTAFYALSGCRCASGENKPASSVSFDPPARLPGGGLNANSQAGDSP